MPTNALLLQFPKLEGFALSIDGSRRPVCNDLGPAIGSFNSRLRSSNHRYSILFSHKVPKSRRSRGVLEDTPIGACQAICTSDPGCAYIGLKCGSHAKGLKGEKRGRCELFGEYPDPVREVVDCDAETPDEVFEWLDLYGYERRIFSKQMNPAKAIVENEAVFCSASSFIQSRTQIVVDHSTNLAGGFNPARSCWSKCIELNCIAYEFYHYLYNGKVRVICELYHVDWKDRVRRDASELQAVVQEKDTGGCSTEINEASLRLRNFTRARELSEDTIATRGVHSIS